MKPENTIVRCGEYDAANIHERLPHQDQKVKHISIHPAFNMKNLYYDVALVHTETNFALDEHIQPICLPDPTSPQPFTGDKPCYTMGYGKDGYGISISFEKLSLEIEVSYKIMQLANNKN